MPKDDTEAAARTPGDLYRRLRHAIDVVIRNRAQLARYLLTSAVVYAFILLALYLVVDLAGVGAIAAYVIVFFCAYMIDYTATLLLVFHRSHSWGNLGRFVLYVALFLSVSTMLYDLLLALGVRYLVAALATSVILMPLRFVANKRWVYR